MVAAAIQMRRVVKTLALTDLDKATLSFRAGLATGTVVGGILGLSRPRFDLWGGTLAIFLFLSLHRRDEYRCAPCF